MKRILLALMTSGIVLAACKKEIQPESVVLNREQALTVIFGGNKIDCKSCMSYADSIAHNGFVINPAVFCANYCKYVKKLK